MTWTTAPLGRIVRMVSGGTPSKGHSYYWQGSIPWVSPKDMGARDLQDTADHISEAAVRESATQVVPAGSVLVVVRSGILANRLPVSICRVPVAINQDLKALLPGDTLLPEYLAYALESESNRILTAGVKRGATVHSVDVAKLQQLELPVPPPSEQRRIVEILDQANCLRRLRAEADNKVDRVPRALYQGLFLDRVSGWPREPLGALLRKTKGALQSGPFGTHLHNSDFVRSGSVRVVGIDNVLDGEFSDGRDRRITAEKYEELKKYTLEPDDVLLTIMGTVGRCCVFPRLHETAICTKHVYRIQVDERLDPKYLSASIRFCRAVRAQLGASTTGQIVAGIKSADIRRLEIVIPPRALQDRFASQVRRLEQQRTHRRRAKAQLDRLFQTLLRRAFSGALTARWRQRHMKDLLQEMVNEQQG
jgi:type I restriction enzyme S subunit